MAEKRLTDLHIRVLEEEKREIQEKAKALGLGMSAYVRMVLTKAEVKVEAPTMRGR